MLNKLDKLYYSIPQSNIVYRVVKYSIRVVANLYAKHFMPIKTKAKKVSNDTIIVSLTSYPLRIKNIWMTIASLLNQDYDNMHIVLWLSKNQFPNKHLDLPSSLTRLEEKGLEIKFVEDDLRPHKKYYYTLNEFPDNDFITVDDDVIYNSQLIKTLVTVHKKMGSNSVVCNRALILSSKTYANWNPCTNSLSKSSNIFPTGVGGVLYPAHIFDKTPIQNIEGITTCLNGDDLWLNFMTRYGGNKVIYTGFKTGYITILSSQSSALCHKNVRDENDIQIKRLSNWTKKTLGCDFFINSNN